MSDRPATIGELRAAGWVSRTVKEEIRRNVVARLAARQPLVDGIVTSFGVPSHQLSLVATQRIGARFNVTLDFVATNEYLAPLYDPSTFTSRAFEFGGLRKADVSASYAIPLDDRTSLRVFGKVENLFDRDYFESGFRTPGAIASGGVQLRF